MKELKHFTFKPSKKQKFARAISRILEVIILISIEFILLIGDIFMVLLKLIIKFRTPIRRATVSLGVIIFLFINFTTFVESPKSAHALVLDPKNISKHQQIYDYILQVFGKDSDKAFTLLGCENSSLNPEAINDNTTFGGIGRDWGVFQINDTWQKVQPKFLLNWKINIEIAYQLYTENHNRFNLWTCGKKMGI